MAAKLKIEKRGDETTEPIGCGGHLGRRAEPADIFLEENHPMTTSSTFSSY
jgi:hypothetical protein